MISSLYFQDQEDADMLFFITNDQNEIEKKAGKDVLGKLISTKNEEGFAQLTTFENQQEVCYFFLPQMNDNEHGKIEAVRNFLSQNINKNSSLYIEFKKLPQHIKLPCLEGVVLSNYIFDKPSAKHQKKPCTIYLNPAEERDTRKTYQVLEEVGWARDLVNLPLSHLNAEQLALSIQQRNESLGIKTEVFDIKKLQDLKMGGILAVNKGSIDPPTMTVSEYKPKNAINEQPYVLVGKGVVYDTGGMSLKPTAQSMDKMKSDMGGAACISATLTAIAKLQLPIYVKALIPATDNRPGQNAYVPGDVIHMHDQTTVEVLNTDAEGRMILADALAYSQQFDPQLVIDAATLTGTAARTTGPNAIIAMTNAEKSIQKKFSEAGFEVFERLAWMPFWDDYKDELKSEVADLKNIGGAYAGHIVAGKFLEHFTDHPFVHLDIAGPSFIQSKNGYKSKGATGYGVRMLTSFFKNLAEHDKK